MRDSIAQQEHPASPLRPVFAWAVHAYTATGTVIAFLATLAVFEGRYRTALLWLFAATLVDASDGVLARAARVKEHTPRFDGARLDDIVDYLTFVFVPILLVYHAGHLPEGWGLAVVAAVLLSSGYGFASADAKTSDHFFTGFPSYWNMVALYLHAFALRPAVNAAILIVLSALVFVRIGYVYPSRTPALRRTTVALAVVWGVMLVAIVLMLPDVPRRLLVGSLFFPIYYTVLSLVLHFRRLGPLAPRPSGSPAP
jgi:phosphatidylcholine synthase